MLNFEKQTTITLIEAMEIVTKNEIKVLVKNQFAGIWFTPRFAELARCIASIFNINNSAEINEIKVEIENYFEELKEKSKKHIKDSMNDNWDWIF